VNHDLIVFLQGVSATSAAACGLFFFRFWRHSRDTLFACFGGSFVLLACSWTLLALFAPTEETRPYVYSVRLVAVVLLIVGMVAKNRGDHRSPTA
jgi:hypothetical protein